jgi:DNA-binding NarL/FixJ family response regulator
VRNGELGELGGADIGRYLDPTKDGEKFRPVPALGWTRAYHRGDLVSSDETGLVFVGHADDQIKVGGRRIELGEIDAALLSLSGVTAAAAAMRRTQAGGEILVGYLAGSGRPGLADAGGIDLVAAHERLAERLPAALVPFLTVVDTIPRRTSGKIDRNALPWPLPEPAAGSAECGVGSNGSSGTRSAFARQHQISIIDHHELFSASLRIVLREQGFDTHQVAITGGTTAILAQIQSLPAGLALLDLHLGHDEHGQWIDGVDLVKPLRTRGWAVLVVSDIHDEAEEAAAIAAGAIGSVSQSSPFTTLLRTVHTAAAGESLMTEAVRQCWLVRHRGYQTQERELTRRLGRLSTREHEVLNLLAQGYRAAGVAETFVVSVATVRAQIRAILSKLDVNSQLEAVALANGRQRR